MAKPQPLLQAEKLAHGVNKVVFSLLSSFLSLYRFYRCVEYRPKHVNQRVYHSGFLCHRDGMLE